MSKTKQPKVKSPETYEEFLASEWSSYNVHMVDYEPNIPPANYHYRVGECVRYGARPDCRVEEVLMDGRLIHISTHDKGQVYGRPYDNQRRLPLLVWWVDLEPLETEEKTSFARPRIRTQYTQNMLHGLIHTTYFRGLIESPDYQRDYVWTLEDKQRLIRSIFNRMDIGKFVFVEHPYPEHRLEVVDGKQRLSAIRDFMEGKFAYEGKTWFQLSCADKNDFVDLMVQVCQMDSEKVSKADILWVFLSINTGGVPQTEEHVAKAKHLYLEALEKEGKQP